MKKHKPKIKPPQRRRRVGRGVDVPAELTKGDRESLPTLVDKLQLAHQDLQHILQDQQQTLRMMGEILRQEELERERRRMFDDEIRKWEELLNTIGDDAQLANEDLQEMLQKQQQTLQMLSNISKMLFDTAQSVIRKIGG